MSFEDMLEDTMYGGDLERLKWKADALQETPNPEVHAQLLSVLQFIVNHVSDEVTFRPEIDNQFEIAVAVNDILQSLGEPIVPFMYSEPPSEPPIKNLFEISTSQKRILYSILHDYGANCISSALFYAGARLRNKALHPVRDIDEIERYLQPEIYEEPILHSIVLFYEMERLDHAGFVVSLDPLIMADKTMAGGEVRPYYSIDDYLKTRPNHTKVVYRIPIIDSRLTPNSSS